MLERLITNLGGQDMDEIARQRALLAGTEPTRMVLTVLAYGLALIFLPFWFCAVLCVIDVAAEMLGLRAMRNLNPAKHLLCYGATLICVAVAEFCCSFAATVIWQMDTSYSKALAVAMVSLSLVQLTTVRTIHLPYALVGWSSIMITVLVGNTVLWVNQDDLNGFLLSTACVIAGSAFILSAMRSNHALHVGLVCERRAAQAADQAKGRFLAQMSHELRTPLNAIMGMGEAELALTADANTRERMTVLVQSTRGLAVILDDILDMSAIGQGKLTIRPAPANPAAEISAAIALFRHSFATAGLRLDLHLAPGLPDLALFDAQRLRQCLANLLSNALKFTASGGVTVRAKPVETGMLQIEVSDSGPGLPKADHAQVFEPFYRGTTLQGGNGLGLSISRALARAMGGDLVALPSPHGALFRLTFALPPALPARAPVPAVAPPALSARRILVVDDIATNRLVAATFLRILGAQVSEADSGESALAAIRADCPDLVLLDMNMRGLTGPETLARIRALQGMAARLPVLAMTADATSAHRVQYMAAGLDGYLAKPLTLDSLHAALAEQLPT